MYQPLSPKIYVIMVVSLLSILACASSENPQLTDSSESPTEEAGEERRPEQGRGACEVTVAYGTGQRAFYCDRDQSRSQCDAHKTQGAESILSQGSSCGERGFPYECSEAQMAAANTGLSLQGGKFLSNSDCDPTKPAWSEPPPTPEPDEGSEMANNGSGGMQGGGGPYSCGSNPDPCLDVWECAPGDMPGFNCAAACLESTACNPQGVEVNCQIIAGYGPEAVKCCPLCR
jgi:hypothetical protein